MTSRQGHFGRIQEVYYKKMKPIKHGYLQKTPNPLYKPELHEYTKRK